MTANFDVTGIGVDRPTLERIAAHRWRQPSSIRLSPLQLARLDAHASARQISRSELIRAIVRDWLEQADGETAHQPRLFEVDCG